MSSPWKQQPEAVADKVLKRAELSKMARRLQNRLALAQFKTKHGWEDLAFDTIEPRFEEEIRRKRLSDGDVLSDSSSSASDLPPYPTRTLMSSPLKAPFFSDAIGSSSGSTGHRKRNYMSSFDYGSSSPSKRLRSSPTAHRSLSMSHVSWKDQHQLAQSSPIKPRRHQHFTTSSGPDMSFFSVSGRIPDDLGSPNYAAPSDDDDEDLLPAHSFRASHVRASEPSTPPPVRNGGGQTRRNRDKSSSAAPNHNATNNNNGSSKRDRSGGEEGADLLLYLAQSPSPANPSAKSSRIAAPSTPPQKTFLALPSSMMTTPGGGNLFPNTPGQAFDFSDFIHVTPSPAQKPWKTPIAAAGLGSVRTPMSVARRRLTFDDLP